MLNKRQRTLGVACVLAGFTASPIANADDWEWTIAPYLWLPNISLDMGVTNDSGLGGGETRFNNILDKLDAAFMGHFAARNGRWGAFLDVLFVDFSDTSTGSFEPGDIIQGDFAVETELKAGLYDVAGTFRFGEVSPGSVAFDAIAGARYVDIEISALVTLPGPAATIVDIAIGPKETDFLVGGRLMGQLSERWRWSVHADTSFGGTDGTVNVRGLFGYTFGEGLFSLTGGYRYLTLELMDSTAIGADADASLDLSGPMVGAIFRF